METIGFIGLGRLGTPMALNIQKAGYSMVVHDVREAATRPLLEGGAKLATSPAEVAGRSDVVMTSLPAPRDLEEVVLGRDGLLEGMKEGSILLDLSTVGPQLIRRLEPILLEKGVRIMDTPVLSSPAWAAERRVTVMAGGRREDFDRARPIFDAFADKVLYTGGLGTASVCKLANNMTTFVMGQVLAEALTMAIKAGVELDVLLDSGERYSLGPCNDLFTQSVFQGQFQPPIFTLALSLKDVALATQLGRDSGVPMPLANQMEQIMQQCVNKGWGEDDFRKAFLWQEEASGVEVRYSKDGT